MDTDLEPERSGKGETGSHDRGSKPEKEERRQDGTPATLEGNIDNPIDDNKDIGSRPRAQGYPVRWLVSHYPVSATMAAVIAAELGMRGVS